MRALTHSSYANEHPPETSNEALALVGDAALGLVVAEHVLADDPTAAVGVLTPRRAELVSGANLARWAADLGLGTLIRLRRGVDHTAGRARALPGPGAQAVPARRGRGGRAPGLADGGAHRSAADRRQHRALRRGLSVDAPRRIDVLGIAHVRRPAGLLLDVLARVGRAVRVHPARHPRGSRVRPLLHRAPLRRIGESALLHSGTAALSLRHPGRHHPDAVTG